MTSQPAPIAIGVAPNGARRGKADHPALPITARELAREAAACADAGAAYVHLHVRDDRGEHILEADAYREAIAAIRRERGPDELAIQVTTEAGGRYEPPQQMALVRELVPDAVSLSIRELVPSASAEPDAAAFFAWAHGEGIAAQYILYSPEEVLGFEDLLARGVIPDENYWVLFVLGRYGEGDAAPAELLPFLEARKTDYPWSVCAFGARECACALAAAALGGHARVGFENNLLTPRGARAADNAELVAAVRDASRDYLARPAARATALPGS